MSKEYAPIVAIDFDGTIKKSKDLKNYSSGLQPFCYSSLHKLYEKGCRLILWTCRSGEELEKAKAFLKTYGLLDIFEKFNENIDNLGFEPSNKIFANYYIDDLNIGGFMGWRKTTKIVLKDDYFQLCADDYFGDIY